MRVRERGFLSRYTFLRFPNTPASSRSDQVLSPHRDRGEVTHPKKGREAKKNPRATIISLSTPTIINFAKNSLTAHCEFALLSLEW